MADPVFANTMEISSKSMGGKSICQFPDVCFTPPESPATPPGVPIPYPNTGLAGDTTDGSQSVSIGGEQVMLKDSSAFKQSTGDEAGSVTKKGMLTSKNQGKVYFIAWSMDVKVEGENVVRNLDMTTHNHGCKLADGSVPTVHAAQVMVDNFGQCADDAQAVEDACKDKPKKDFCPGALGMSVSELKDQANPRRRLPREAAVAKHASLITQKSAIPARKGEKTSRSEAAGAVGEAEAEGSDCVKKMRCFLRPYKVADDKRDGQEGCCPGQTPHHIPPQAGVKHLPGYKKDHALCVCLEGQNQSSGSHGKNHAAIDYLAGQKLAEKKAQGKKKLDLEEYINVSAAAVAVQCGCKAECIAEQLKKQTFKDNDLSAKVNHEGVTSLQVSATDKAALVEEYAALPMESLTF